MRANHPHRPLIQHMRINHRRLHIRMPQQLLNRPNILPRLQQMRRERMPETMRCKSNRQPRIRNRFPHSPL